MTSPERQSQIRDAVRPRVRIDADHDLPVEDAQRSVIDDIVREHIKRNLRAVRGDRRVPQGHRPDGPRKQTGH